MSLTYPYRIRGEAPPKALYMYSPHQGLPFVSAYYASREAAVARIGAALNAAPGRDVQAVVARWPEVVLVAGAAGDSTVAGRTARTELPMPGASVPDSESLLRQLLATPTVTRGDYFARWAEAFLRRFELSRAIHTSYDGGMRPAGAGLAAFTAYPLLALCLLRFHAAHGDLQALSTTLKLGDRIDGGSEMAHGAEALWLMQRALLVEMTAVRALASRKGVTA